MNRVKVYDSGHAVKCNFKLSDEYWRQCSEPEPAKIVPWMVEAQVRVWIQVLRGHSHGLNNLSA